MNITIHCPARPSQTKSHLSLSGLATLAARSGGPALLVLALLFLPLLCVQGAAISVTNASFETPNVTGISPYYQTLPTVFSPGAWIGYASFQAVVEGGRYGVKPTGLLGTQFGDGTGGVGGGMYQETAPYDNTGDTNLYWQAGQTYALTVGVFLRSDQVPGPGRKMDLRLFYRNASGGAANVLGSRTLTVGTDALSSSALTDYTVTWTVAPGAPEVGKPIGIWFTASPGGSGNTGDWGFDNVRLTRVDAPTRTWTGSPNGNWDVGTTANWLIGATPVTYTNGATVTFDDTASGTTTVTQTTMLTPGLLTVTNEFRNYTFGGSGSITGVRLLKQGAGTLTMLSTNAFGNGNSEIQNGTVVLDGSAGGQTNSVTGQMLVGTATNLHASLILTNNTTLVGNGAQYLGLVSGSTGTLVVADSSVVNKTGGWTSIGGSGAGIATLRDNARINAPGDFNIADLADSSGVLNLSGSPSLTVGTIFVGKAGGSTGIVDQAGGTVDGSGLVLGGLGVGNWRQSGGVINLTNSWVSIGNNGATGVGISIGSLTVSGGTFNQAAPGAALIVGDMPGSSGTTGTLTVQDTGVVNVASTAFGLVIGNNANASGTVNLDGGTLATTCLQTRNGGFGTLNFNGGRLLAGPGAKADFMSTLSAVNVFAGGARIDTGGQNIAINQVFTDGAGGGGLTKLGSGTLSLPNFLYYTGPTLVTSGRLAMTTHFSGTGPVTANDGAELALQVLDFQGAFINPSALTLGNTTGARIVFDFNLYGASPATAPIQTPLLAVNGTNVVDIADNNLAVGQFPLIKYAGRTGTGTFLLGALPAGVQAYLSNNVTAQSVDLVIAGIGMPRWDGQVAGGIWDIDATTNWVDTIMGELTTYREGNAVVFDDNAAGTTVVTLNTTVNPSLVTLSNSSLAYTLQGTGRISGSTGLRLETAGTFTIAGSISNTYTGPTVIGGGGTLVVSNLADGLSPSALGASSADPANLVFAGGTLSYGGPATVINRGYRLEGANSAFDLKADLTLSGAVTATGGTFAKTGPGTLTFSAAGMNTLSVGGGAGAFDVRDGKVVLAGSSGQTNDVRGECWVGSTPDSSASLVLTNTTLAVSSWLGVGRGNGAVGNSASVSVYSSILTCTNLSLGFDAGLPGNLATQSLALANSSSFTVGGAAGVLVGESAGSSAVLLIQDTSSLTSDNYMSVGVRGSGTAVVRDQAVLRLASDFNIADLANSQGTLAIQDNALVEWAGNGGSAFYVGKGDGSAGTVIQTGGTLRRVSGSTGDWRIGGNATTSGSGAYYLSGGVLDAGDINFQIGASGAGTFEQSGGIASAGGFVSAARFAGSTGTLTVSGGSFSSSNTGGGGCLIIGEAGAGTLNVAGTGRVNVFSSTFGLVVGNSVTAVGIVNLDGGALATTFVQSRQGGSGFFNFNGGLLQVLPGAGPGFMAGLTAANVLSGGARIDTGTNTAVIAQPLLGGGGDDGGLTKLGAGVLALDGLNTYTNTTAVSNGTLLVNGFVAGSVVVRSGAALGGTGAIGGAVAVDAGGTLAAGNGIGTLTLNDSLTLAGNLLVELDKSLSPSNDLVVVSGALNNTGAGTVAVANLGPALAAGDRFTLFSRPLVNGNALTVVSGPGVTWTNKLAVDGSIEVLAVAGGMPPGFPPGAVTSLPDGNISLTATGALGATYRLWASTNVASTPITATWTLLSSGTITASPFTVFDLAATNHPRRFYLFSTP